MSRVKKIAAPELAIRADVVHGPARASQQRAANAVNGPTQTTFNWSGLVVNDQQPYLDAWGTWTIPEVQAPPGQTGSFSSSAWIGLGGFTDKNLFQAGTEHDIDSNGNTTFFAWVERFPAPSVAVQNFAVEPGQTIAIFVGALGDGSGRGIFSMANLETGLMVPLTIIPIPNNVIAGFPTPTAVSATSAEWIVERPAINPQLQLAQLADYGEINFTDAGATISTANGGKSEASQISAAGDGNATEIVMLSDDQQPISQEAVTPAVHCTFLQTAQFGPPGNPWYAQ